MILRMRISLILVASLAFIVTSETTSSKSRLCARFPAGTTRPPRSGDNGYEIRVTKVGRHRKIRRFEPGRTYEVTIRSRYPLESFSNFYLTAVVDRMMKNKKMKEKNPPSPGNFVHVANPPRTTNLKDCPGVITAVYRGARLKVRLLWTAPDFAKDCIMFKATVEKSYPGIYFKDAGRLTQTICPGSEYASDEAISDRRMPTFRECCACGTATYKMTFQGKWIRQLHPRDWPKNEAYIHWSNIIGASHNREYLIYYYGGMAGQGVRSVCQFGDPSVLEGEFKTEAGSNILNIIKTRGIWEAKNMGESRTAIFAVNRTHHLMSMLTMMGPSPDWCAGISAKDLCMRNCTWAKTLNVSLYPWDAGVRPGYTYIQRGVEDQVPRKPIREITKNWPRGNPFSVEDDGRLRPVATVTIERLSPKKDYQCDRKPMRGLRPFKPVQDDSQQYGRPGKHLTNIDKTKQLAPSLQNMIPNMCFMTPWSPWTPCSATCGSGTMMRRRRIERNLKPPLCKYVKLKEKRDCMGPARTCNHSLPCSVTDWSNWSPCNATCNSEGKRTRSRSFIRMKEAEMCSKTVKTHEMMNCTYRCDESITCSAAMVEGYPCYAPAKRYYYNMRKKQCLPFTYRGCKGSKNNFKSKEDCHRVCDNAFNSMAKWKIERAAQLQWDATKKKMLASKGKTMRSCKQPMDEGHLCRRRKGRKGRQMPQTRWYFNMKTKRCQEMKFKGCSGNDNNFFTAEDCRTNCRQLMKAKNMISGPPQNCKLGNWGPWGPCDSICGGRRMRSRRVIAAPLNGGRPCPQIYQFAQCKRRNCKPCRYSSWSGWSACTTTCGGGVMERTRTKLAIKQDNCTPDRPEYIQRTSCNAKPCPLIRFPHREQ